jgi:hypothetical protein
VRPIFAFAYVAMGFVVGGVTYFLCDRVLESSGGALRKPAPAKRYLDKVRHTFGDLLHRLHLDHLPNLVQHGPDHARKVEYHAMLPAMAEAHGGSAPTAIFLGAVLDGIPSSIVIGAQLVAVATFDPTFVIAVAVANLPQAMSSAAGMRVVGMSARRIQLQWLALTIASGVFAAIGNFALVGASPILTTLVEAVGGGATLAMLASTMMPEAFEEGGPSVGLLTIAGFLSAFLFTALKIGSTPG